MSQRQPGYPDSVAEPSNEALESIEESRGTRVVLELAPGGDCFMDDLEGTIVDVAADYNDGICRCEVTVCGSDGDCDCGDSYDCECDDRESDGGECEVVHMTSPICDCCPGVIFSDYGCVPRILSRNEDSFVIATYVPSVEVVSDLVSELRGICSRVEVRSLVNTDACGGSAKTQEVDLSHLTAKQRDAVARAVEAGYYDTPQAASLEELAAEFEISPSALSQRLGRAEGAVLGQIFDNE
jgi:predicted DNA binding protein